MARLFTSGLESNSLTLAAEGMSALSGSPAISSVNPRSGTYSLRNNPSGATMQAGTVSFSAPGLKTAYFRFYLYINTYPANDSLIFGTNAATNFPARIRGTGAGIKIVDGNNTQVGSNVALSTGQWYRIEVKVFSNASTGTLDMLVDGSSQVSATGLNTNGADITTLSIGSAASLTHDYYVDDIAANDGTGSFQNTYPGSGKVVRLLPNAAGDVNTFTAFQVGGTAGSSNNYTRVKELAPDDATSYNGGNTVGNEDLFNVDNSGIGASDTVNLVAVGARFSNNVASASCTIKFEIEKTAAGTIAQSAGIITNSVSWFTNNLSIGAAYPLMLYQDPDSASWTQSTVDSMQIGYKITANGASNSTLVSALWALVEYVPGVAPPAGSTSDFFQMF